MTSLVWRRYGRATTTNRAYAGASVNGMRSADILYTGNKISHTGNRISQYAMWPALWLSLTQKFDVIFLRIMHIVGYFIVSWRHHVDLLQASPVIGNLSLKLFLHKDTKELKCSYMHTYYCAFVLFYMYTNFWTSVLYVHTNYCASVLYVH